MLRALAGAALRGGRFAAAAPSAAAAQLQQKRFLNIHEYQVRFLARPPSVVAAAVPRPLARPPPLIIPSTQTPKNPQQGAALMKSFGINVPDGQPAHTVEDVERIAPVMADEKGEVGSGRRSRRAAAAAATATNPRPPKTQTHHPNQKPTTKTKNRSSSSPRSSPVGAAWATSPTA
jgi:hypothetical protein